MGLFKKSSEWFRSIDKNKLLLRISGFLLFIALLSVIYYFYIFNGSTSTDQIQWGLFGDYTGGFGGMLISLVAVLLIFITYRLQQKELKATSEALDLQNKQARAHQAQNILFNLLERKDLVQSNIKTGYSGEAAIKSIYKHYSDKVQQYIDKGNEKEKATELAMEDFYATYNTNLTPYINIICGTVSYLESAVTTEEQRETLFEIFKSTLTNTERLVLLLTFESKYKFDPSADRFESCYDTLIENNIV